MDRPIRAAILDLDGTLVDTALEIHAALNATLADLGEPPVSLAAATALIGRGVRSLVERAMTRVDPAALHRAVETFEAHYAKTVGTNARLFDGVLPGLRRFRDARVPLAVVTNKPRIFTERLLECLEVRALFAALVAGDDGIARKPAGDMLLAACRAMGTTPEATLMIGDSDNDVLAARAAGCAVWCVPYGYNEGRGAETLACDRLVATLDEAARLILADATR